MTVLSFGLIIVSLVTLVYDDSSFFKENSKYLTISLTSMSIFSLIVAITVQKSNFALRAEKFRMQGMAISDLRLSFMHQINAPGIDEKKVYDKKSKKYSRILNRHITHDQIDFLITSTSGIERKFHTTKLFITEHIGYWIIILTTLLLLTWISSGIYNASITS